MLSLILSHNFPQLTHSQVISLTVLSLTLLVLSLCYPSHTSSMTELSHMFPPTHTLTHVLSQSVLSECSHTHVLSLTLLVLSSCYPSYTSHLTHSFLTHSLTECSLRVFSFTFSHQLFSLTHVIPDTLSQSVLTHTLTPTHSHQLTHTLTECSHTTCSPHTCHP